MDETEFKRRAQRLQEIAKVLEKLPVEVRVDAFAMLQGYVDGGAEVHPRGANQKRQKPARVGEEHAESMEDFVTKFNHDQHSDNVRLISAYFYREYGTEPFSVDDVRDAATNAGLIIPDRVDMTLKAAMEKGKKLYQRAGKGKWRPTVHGEVFLKTVYHVAKGKKTRPEAEAHDDAR